MGGYVNNHVCINMGSKSSLKAKYSYIYSVIIFIRIIKKLVKK